MNVHIDPKYERQLEDLAASLGKSADDVVQDILLEKLANVPQDDSAALAEKQRKAIEAFLVKLDALPDESPDDGFDASQHNKVIYRRDW